MDTPLRVIVSSWVRIADNIIPSRGKITGGYINSSLAKDQAEEAGYDDAIMLNTAGKIAEGSGANLFIVRNGTLITSPSYKRHSGRDHPAFGVHVRARCRYPGRRARDRPLGTLRCRRSVLLRDRCPGSGRSATSMAARSATASVERSRATMQDIFFACVRGDRIPSTQHLLTKVPVRPGVVSESLMVFCAVSVHGVRNATCLTSIFGPMLYSARRHISPDSAAQT